MIGFVVLGTLYHVVPFVVWVHRYSDRLGYERVPMVDDLYDGRLAAADFAALLGGCGGLAIADLLDGPRLLFLASGALAAIGIVSFVASLPLVVRT